MVTTQDGIVTRRATGCGAIERHLDSVAVGGVRDRSVSFVANLFATDHDFSGFVSVLEDNLERSGVTFVNRDEGVTEVDVASACLVNGQRSTVRRGRVDNIEVEVVRARVKARSVDAEVVSIREIEAECCCVIGSSVSLVTAFVDSVSIDEETVEFLNTEVIRRHVNGESNTVALVVKRRVGRIALSIRDCSVLRVHAERLLGNFEGRVGVRRLNCVLTGFVVFRIDGDASVIDFEFSNESPVTINEFCAAGVANRNINLLTHPNAFSIVDLLCICRGRPARKRYGCGENGHHHKRGQEQRASLVAK
nr:hypothetical protein [Haloterrigena salifodinae]